MSTSTVEDLAAMQSTTPDPITAAEELAAIWDLPPGLRIVGAERYGVGSLASVTVRLSSGTSIDFASMRDISNPTRLRVEIASTVGLTPKITADRAVRCVALLLALAVHRATQTADDAMRNWCLDFLQEVAGARGSDGVPAGVIDLEMADMAQRFDAFEQIDRLDPLSGAASAPVIARRCIVLRDVQSGERFVRSSWFHGFVRAEDHKVAVEAIPTRAIRVGWDRRNSQGRINARSAGRVLSWPFYTVPAGWEDGA